MSFLDCSITKDTLPPDPHMDNLNFLLPEEDNPASEIERVSFADFLFRGEELNEFLV